MHVNSFFAWSHPEAMKGSSSSRLLILSRLLTSPVWAQLTLTDPNWGPWSLYLQNGDPSHRVRAHSLTRVQNSRYLERKSIEQTPSRDRFDFLSITNVFVLLTIFICISFLKLQKKSFPIYSFTVNVYFFVPQLSLRLQQTVYCAIPGGNWQSLPWAGEVPDSNPGPLHHCQVRYY